MGVMEKQAMMLERAAMNSLRRDSRIRALREEMISSLSYKSVGYRAFRDTRTSSVEHTVMRMEEWGAKSNKP